MKEAYYFSHDGNARNDEKLLAVRMKYKWEGYGLFWAIVEKLRESTDYILSKDYNLIAFDLRTDASIVKSLIEDFGLFIFTEDGKYFYSERLSNSMNLKESKSKQASENALKRWQKSGNDAPALQMHNQSNAIKVKESKVKESKVKESKVKESKVKEPEGLFDFRNIFFILGFSEDFNSEWLRWKDFKLKHFKFIYKTKDSELSAIYELYNISKKNEQTAKKIIEKSIANGWKGFFELKEDFKNGNNQRGSQQTVSTTEFGSL